MKTKILTNLFFTSIVISYFTLFVYCFSSCSGKYKPRVKTKTTEFKVGDYSKVKIVEIDSCEYLWGDWGYASVLSHKGNCKFCAEREKHSSK